ncbi:iron transporter [Salinibacter altiplanensis]|uniref:iron transporter n=1 Tax=Salinibacter altiplanensis TaxID=1803181 RepID=UPI000C9FEE17|nr:iron transporter [Salinibacter altiplanensis]
MTTRLFSSLLALLLIAAGLGPAPALAQERVLGEEVIEPGIQLTFEAAPQDDVTPYDQNLSEEATDVHLEVLVGWSEDPDVDVPEGAARGGFVGYLQFFATLTNEATGQEKKVDFIPHLTLGDAMHYARNISLPGGPGDSYTVTMDVRPPSETEMAFHESWREAHGTPLFEARTFTYESLDLAEVAAATRE